MEGFSTVGSGELLSFLTDALSIKIFLLSQEPLDSAPVNISALLDILRDSRNEFTDLLVEYMRAPDGSYEENFRLPGSDEPPKRATSVFNLETNNPLSLHKEVINHDSLRNIAEDRFRILGSSGSSPLNFGKLSHRTSSERTQRSSYMRPSLHCWRGRFPEIPFFREPSVQTQLTNILFLYAAITPSIGYRQG